MKQKTDFLKGLDTKSLVNRLHQIEDELELALLEEAEFKHQNSQFLSSYSSDCRAVEEFMAGLEPPEDGRKWTVDGRKSWLTLQRRENPQLSNTIGRQFDVTFGSENSRIKVEMLIKRLEGVRAVLALKTAQIRFLTSP